MTISLVDAQKLTQSKLGSFTNSQLQLQLSGNNPHTHNLITIFITVTDRASGAVRLTEEIEQVVL